MQGDGARVFAVFGAKGPGLDGVEFFIIILGDFEAELGEAVVVGGLDGEGDFVAGLGVEVAGGVGDGDGGGLVGQAAVRV